MAISPAAVYIPILTLELISESGAIRYIKIVALLVVQS
jgi:hypothetical protein